MATATEEKQADQSQEKQSGGGISQGINTLNNLRGLRNLSGKAGLRGAAQAGKLAAQAGARAGMFLFTNPVGWVILAIIVIAIITFIVVFSLGAPPTQTTVSIPTPAPPVAL